MLSLIRKKIESDAAPESVNDAQDAAVFPFDPNADDTIPRIASAEDGTIVFASSAFMQLSHLSPDDLMQGSFGTILKFGDKTATPETIEEGVHQIHINGHQNPFSFHFDWLEMPNNRRFLIGSLADTPEDAPQEAPPARGRAENENSEIIQTMSLDGLLGTKPSSPHIICETDIEHLLDLSHEIMVVSDNTGNILRVNATFKESFGYSDENLQGVDFLSLFDDEDQPIVRQHLQNFAFGDESDDNVINDFEARIRTKNGKNLWMEWRQQQKGDLLYCTGRDITDIKSQEKALLRREAQLLQAESIARMGHWRWVLGKDEIEWSREIFRIFGVENQDGFEPTLDSMNTLIHRRDVDRVNQALQRAVIEEKDYDVEFRIIRPDGETRFIRSEGRCSRNESGEITALFGIMKDMTERVLYEAELREAKDAAERAYAAKTQFLANMSHELRTPLNAIIGFSEMIERQLLGPIGTEKYLDYISGIRDSGEHLLDLISDILDMSKIEAGKYELMLEDVNIAKTVKMAAHMMEGRALESNVKINVAEIENEDLQITADRRAVMQILLNLLSNAVKFSKENGEITVECNAHKDYVICKVIDNGIGIPANKLATITKPFEQVSSSYARDHEGSGLGLAITKELAELHGGTLHIESSVDRGTTVSIRLPYSAILQAQSAA